MKKNIVILISILVLTSVLLVGCNNAKFKNEESKIKVVSDELLEETDDAKVKLEEIELLMQEDLAKKYWVARYTNKSQYPLKQFQAIFIRKDTNELELMTFNGDVEIGENSYIISLIPPKTNKFEDIEYLAFNYKVDLGDGKVQCVTYDEKTSKYYTKIIEI